MADHSFDENGKCKFCGCGTGERWAEIAKKPCRGLGADVPRPGKGVAARLRKEQRQRNLNNAVLKALASTFTEIVAGRQKPPPGVRLDEIKVALEWTLWEISLRPESKARDGHRADY